MSYAELFCQSNFSFLTGASHAEELVLQAAFYRYQAIAITDECSVAGIVKAHTTIEQHKLDIKQIVGSMFWLNDECQVVLLCPCRKAYAELCRIITNARRRSEKGSYQLSEWDLMSIRHCLVLWLPTHQESDHYWGRWLQQHHAHRLWVAIQRHLDSDDNAYITHCELLASEFELPITACGGVLMHAVERLPLQHVLTAVKHSCSVDKLGFGRLSNAERALRPLNKLSRIYKSEWLAESTHIASLCAFKLSELKYEYPTELIPDGYTPTTYLRMLVERGKKRRFPEGVPSDIHQTIENELTLIEELQYHYYFLTIHDIVMFAKQQGILYQGRGSAANSVVCYCLEITAVDPRQISVLFERFISRERKEPPDIDVDFEHERQKKSFNIFTKSTGASVPLWQPPLSAIALKVPCVK